MIKTTAYELDVWQFMDPSKKPGQIPVLEASIEPCPGIVKPPTTTVGTAALVIWNPTEAQIRDVKYSTQSEDEREQLRQQLYRRNYEFDRALYYKRREAIGRTRTRIVDTIEDNTTYISGIESPHQILIKLKNRFSPTDKIRELELDAK
jgi:hypothetical protein